MTLLPLLAVVTGVIISLQATLNARLGVLLENPLQGTAMTFCIGGCLSLLMVAVDGRWQSPANTTQAVPGYLWFSGGVLGVMGISMLYYLIPKIGISNVTVLSLCGQLILATTASHFGWFHLPTVPFTAQKAAGLVILMAGTLLVTGKPLYGQ